jgi:hypothetical protein
LSAGSPPIRVAQAGPISAAFLRHCGQSRNPGSRSALIHNLTSRARLPRPDQKLEARRVRAGVLLTRHSTGSSAGHLDADTCDDDDLNETTGITPDRCRDVRSCRIARVEPAHTYALTGMFTRILEQARLPQG